MQDKLISHQALSSIMARRKLYFGKRYIASPKKLQLLSMCRSFELLHLHCRLNLVRGISFRTMLVLTFRGVDVTAMKPYRLGR
jgi:hypothetical protein